MIKQKYLFLPRTQAFGKLFCGFLCF